VIFLLRISSLAALLVTVATTGALANGPTSRADEWDFTVQTRYIAETTVDGKGGGSVSLEDDLGWGFGFGFNKNEKLNIGFFMNWRNTNYTATGADSFGAVDSLTYSNFLESGTIALAVDFNLMPKKITPYVSGAVGYTIVDSNIPGDIYSGCYWDPWYGYICGSGVATYSEDAASYSLGVGLRIETAGALFFKIGYERNWIDVDSSFSVDMMRIDGGFTLR
jgi:Outer membrane protein beta-barrel domain